MRHRQASLLLVLLVLLVPACVHRSSSETRVLVGEGAPMNPGVFAANNTVCTVENLPANEAFRSLVRGLGITSMRYPGGSTASFWDWETARYVPVPEITRIWAADGGNWMLQLVGPVAKLPQGLLGPAHFADFTAATGMAAQWVPNLTTRADTQLAMFRMLKDRGVDVKYVEMDNETYFWSNEFGIDAESGRRYSDRVVALAPRLRALYPDVEIGIVVREDDYFVAHDSKEQEKSGDARFEHWNEHVLADRMDEHVDAIILHHYVMQQSRLDPYETDEARGAAFLAFPQVTLERAARLIEERYGGLPMWITEYNVIGYYRPGESVSDRWMDATKDTPWSAFYQASYWLTGLSRPDAVGILNHHSISNMDLGWGLGRHISETEADLSCVGQLFAHLAHLAKEHETMHPLVFEGGGDLGISIEDVERVSALYGAAMGRGDGRTLVIMNRGVDPVSVRVEGLKAATVTTYFAEEAIEPTARVRLDHPELSVWEQGPMTPERKTVASGWLGSSAVVELPGWSLSIVEMDD
ncbi:hypothetical protein [Mucisphaera calidilacus]|uniref:Uncharacterized protein n=1 Tax=Mucisphaera calidilacus TaxID=2527982 RepID=A0A518BYS2_9BACT|nr:hypothetical protein [Mucisphaera calidilacus]QDU72123.1 hypothetical protein Pan265_19850 [Mucisphaera calidilacus]